MTLNEKIWIRRHYNVQYFDAIFYSHKSIAPRPLLTIVIDIFDPVIVPGCHCNCVEDKLQETASGNIINKGLKGL